MRQGPIAMLFPLTETRPSPLRRVRPGGELNAGSIGALIDGTDATSVFLNGREVPLDADRFVELPAGVRSRLRVHTRDVVYAVYITVKDGPPRRLVVGEDIPAAQRYGAPIPVTAQARVELLRLTPGADVRVDGLVPARTAWNADGTVLSVWVDPGEHELRVLDGPTSLDRALNGRFTVNLAPAEIVDVSRYDFVAADAPSPTRVWFTPFIPDFVFTTGAPSPTDPAPTEPSPTEPDPTDPAPTWPSPTDGFVDPTEAPTEEPTAAPTDPPLYTPPPTNPALSQAPGATGVASLVLSPPTASASLDGVAVTGVRAEVRLAPGRHRLRVSAPGYVTREVDVDVSAGYVTDVGLELARDPSVAPVTKSAPKVTGGWRWAAAVAAGGAALVGGGLLALHLTQKRSAPAGAAALPSRGEW